MASEPFVDIHCHLLPGIDDGAKDVTESLAMARLAVADGISTIVCTPHQCGNYTCNTNASIRLAVDELQSVLDQAEIPLQLLPGADVRIESSLLDDLLADRVVSLGDHRRHVLLELPHELYFPLDGLHANLKSKGITGILSHPERNQGILDQPALVKPLVDLGVLMQITAGSLVGTFGDKIQKFSEDLVCKGLVHFISTDAHSSKRRRPLMQRAYSRAVQLVGENSALEMCCRNPMLVAKGQDVAGGVRAKSSGGWRRWFSRRTAA
jgi:protein-tyrosine phosphatase